MSFFLFLVISVIDLHSQRGGKGNQNDQAPPPPPAEDEAPPAGDAEVPPAGDAEVPPAGDAEVPPAGDAEVPPAGDAEVPPAGDAEVPPAGDAEVPPAGDAEVPPAGDAEVPPAGDAEVPTPDAEAGAEPVRVHGHPSALALSQLRSQTITPGAQKTGTLTTKIGNAKRSVKRSTPKLFVLFRCSSSVRTCN
ncbi:hypothetical protein BDV98DRAFT_47733 [Pterulicium gracile]|uniref:Uncharacterized protein n=1 Tax=Pterulicium gracile TaxID=1884261 RepID=A0A5C3QLI1_9AGAR|nr:hypothetical protein BDV98DRAFT_47733 [Pterula gracilis]